jgi:hypothetical protein
LELTRDFPRPGWIRGDSIGISNGPVTAKPAPSKEKLRARESILVGAIDGPEGNAIYLLETGNGQEVNAGSYAYNDDPLQRRLYLDTLKELEQEGLVVFIKNALYELTYEGLKIANELKESGVKQDTPNL